MSIARSKGKGPSGAIPRNRSLGFKEEENGAHNTRAMRRIRSRSFMFCARKKVNWKSKMQTEITITIIMIRSSWVCEVLNCGVIKSCFELCGVVNCDRNETLRVPTSDCYWHVIRKMRFEKLLLFFQDGPCQTRTTFSWEFLMWNKFSNITWLLNWKRFNTQKNK